MKPLAPAWYMPSTNWVSGMASDSELWEMPAATTSAPGSTDFTPV